MWHKWDAGLRLLFPCISNTHAQKKDRIDGYNLLIYCKNSGYERARFSRVVNGNGGL